MNKTRIKILFVIIILLIFNKNELVAQENFVKYRVGNDVFIFYENGKIISEVLGLSGEWVDYGNFITIEVFSSKLGGGLNLMSRESGVGEKKYIEVFQVLNYSESVTMSLIGNPIHLNNKVQSKNQDDAESDYKRGIKFYNEGSYQTALNNFNSAVDLKPNDSLLSIIYFSRAKTLWKLKELDLCLSDLESASIIDSNNPEIYFLRAEILYDKNKFKAALEDYNNAIHLDSLNYHFYEGRAICLIEFNNYDEIYNDCSRAIYLGSENIDIYRLRASINYKRKNYSEAIKDCSYIIRTNRYYDWAIKLRGDCYFSLNKFEEAQTDFQKCSGDTLVFCKLAYIFLDKKKYGDVKYNLDQYNQYRKGNYYWYAEFCLALLYYEYKNSNYEMISGRGGSTILVSKELDEIITILLKNEPNIKKGLDFLKPKEEFKYFTTNQKELSLKMLDYIKKNY